MLVGERARRGAVVTGGDAGQTEAKTAFLPQGHARQEAAQRRGAAILHRRRDRDRVGSGGEGIRGRDQHRAPVAHRPHDDAPRVVLEDRHAMDGVRPRRPRVRDEVGEHHVVVPDHPVADRGDVDERAARHAVRDRRVDRDRERQRVVHHGDVVGGARLAAGDRGRADDHPDPRAGRRSRRVGGVRRECGDQECGGERGETVRGRVAHPRHHTRSCDAPVGPARPGSAERHRRVEVDPADLEAAPEVADVPRHPGAGERTVTRTDGRDDRLLRGRDALARGRRGVDQHLQRRREELQERLLHQRQHVVAGRGRDRAEELGDAVDRGACFAVVGAVGRDRGLDPRERVRGARERGRFGRGRLEHLEHLPDLASGNVVQRERLPQSPRDLSRRGPRDDHALRAAPAGDQVRALELAQGLADRRAVHAELRRQLELRRQGVAELERAVEDSRGDLARDPAIAGRERQRFEGRAHAASTSSRPISMRRISWVPAPMS